MTSTLVGLSPRPSNFAKVDDWVWRGGRPTPRQAVELWRSGVRVALNLEWEESDDDLWPPRVRMVRVADAEWLPLLRPSLEDQHVLCALRAVRDAEREGVVYVHCRSGQNRTGVIVAAYRLIVKLEGLQGVLKDFYSFGGWWAWADCKYINSIQRRVEYFRSVLCTASALDE